MQDQTILANISKHISLRDEEVSHFLSMLETRSVKKNELVLQNNKPCKHIHFVNSGLLRAYYTGYDGKESTVMFAITDWWITDMYAFINQRPAMVTIAAVQPSDILSLPKQKLDQLFIDTPKFERFFRIIMQNAYIREQLRVIQNLSEPAEERYHKFLKKYPQIAGYVTQKQIASYLGVTPEFLSTLRANKR